MQKAIDANGGNRWGAPQGREPVVVPESLWRAFTVDPMKLSIYSLSMALQPGKPDPNDSTKVADGNELGVYMSTNRTMVEAAYAHSPMNLSVACPLFDDDGVRTNLIQLPQCGVVLEIPTAGLTVRMPQIKPSLVGHYNNGFGGHEFISDSVPGGHYSVRRLILSRYANDSARLVVDVREPSTHQMVEEAVEKIQAEFKVRRDAATELSKFFESLPEAKRLNYFVWKKAWQAHVEKKYSSLP